LKKAGREIKARAASGADVKFGATDLWLLLVMLIWGSNFTVVKFSIEDQLSPLAFTALRFITASVMMPILLGVSGRDFKVDRRDAWRLFALSLLGNVTYQVLFIYGMAWTRAGNAALILATTPMFTAMIGRMRRREYFTSRGVAGLLLAFVGIVLIIAAGHKEFAFDKALLGDVLLIGATLCWTVYTVWAQPLVQAHGALKATTLIMVSGTPALLLISAPSLASQDWGRVSMLGWMGAVFSGALAIALAQILWNDGVRKIGPTRTAVYSNLTPVVAVLVAWPALGEVPTSGQVLGAVIIFIGIYLVRGGMTGAATEEDAEREMEETSLRPGQD
jgi:drug/metabolite transporter (DMT)-like permease